PGGKLPRRQGLERAGIDDYSLRLVEGANHVLAQRVIDPGLAAHRGVDLGKQRGWHLDEVDPALIASRSKTGHITNHTTPKGDDGGASVVAGLQQTVEDLLQGLPGLEYLAVRQHHRGDGVVAQRAAQSVQIERCDGFIGNQSDLTARYVARKKPLLGQQPRPEIDGI